MSLTALHFIVGARSVYMESNSNTMHPLSIKKQIIDYLHQRGGSLTYYQLDRKLSNDGLHHFIPALRETLNELVKSGEIEITEVKNDVEYYSLPQKRN